MPVLRMCIRAGCSAVICRGVRLHMQTAHGRAHGCLMLVYILQRQHKLDVIHLSSVAVIEPAFPIAQEKNWVIKSCYTLKCVANSLILGGSFAAQMARCQLHIAGLVHD